MSRSIVLTVGLSLACFGCSKSMHVERSGPLYPQKRNLASVIWRGDVPLLRAGSHDFLGTVTLRQDRCGHLPKDLKWQNANEGRRLGGDVVVLECGSFAIRGGRADSSCACVGEVLRLRPGWTLNKAKDEAPCEKSAGCCACCRP